MAGKSSKEGGTPLRLWLWRSFLRAALVPLLLIELSFLGVYFATSSVVYDRSATAVKVITTAALEDVAVREAQALSNRLLGIETLTKIFADQTARALVTPAEVSQEVKSAYTLLPNGVLYSAKDRGGAASFYSGITPIGLTEYAKVWRTERLDPLMKSIVETEDLVTQIYLNTYDSYNRIYPFLDVLKAYPPRMDLPSYNFYFLADAVHNPNRRVVWTDVYLDPAGAGWMMSAIAPAYSPTRLEAVVGTDVTVAALIDEVLNIALDHDGYALLISRDGTLLALPPAAEADFGMVGLGDMFPPTQSGSDLVRPQAFNLFKRPEFLPLANALIEQDSGTKMLTLRKPVIAAWSTIKGPDWKLLVISSEEETLTPARVLRQQLGAVGLLLFGLLVLFYAGFFAYLWQRAKVMSNRVAKPLADIEGTLRDIAMGVPVGARPQLDVTELQNLSDNLAKMEAQLRAADHAKARFLSSMSHELRTPLNAVVGLSEVLQDSSDDPDRQEKILAISQAGQRLVRMVDGLISLAQIDQTDMTFTAETVDLLPAIVTLLASAQDMANKGQVELVFRPPAMGPALGSLRARAHLETFQQVMAQIISNALKFTKPGGSVCLGFTQTKTEVSVEVTDTGQGISEQQMAKVFAPFERLGQENGPISGTGIGLTLAQRRAARMGARIEFDSRLGQGSTFRLVMPRG